MTFVAYSQAILDEWIVLQERPSERRAESPNAWFKLEAYALLKHYIEADLLHIFQEQADKWKRPHKLIEEATKNPFKLGLLAMFADESPLSRNQRLVFGNQMLYGWFHDIPPEFLNAFLAVSGGPGDIAHKLKGMVIEPGFEDRYVAERLIRVRTDGRETDGS
jgi:hypothetical protein